MALSRLMITTILLTIDDALPISMLTLKSILIISLFSAICFDGHVFIAAVRVSFKAGHREKMSMIAKDPHQYSTSVPSPEVRGSKSTHLTANTTVRSKSEGTIQRLQNLQSTHYNSTISDLLQSISATDQLVVVLVGLPGWRQYTTFFTRQQMMFHVWLLR